MADPLMKLNTTELRSRLQGIQTRAKNLAEKAKKPLIQGGFGLSAVAGGVLGGAVAGMHPKISKVPTDGLLGAVIAVPCLMAAGSPVVDAAAMAGWGMIGGAGSRQTHNSVRAWREQRAADDGDALAKQIVAAQASLDALRKQRDEAPAKK